LKDIRFGEIPLLSGLDRVNLARLIPSFEQVHVESGEILFKQGEPGDSLYFIVDGIIRVFLDTEAADERKSPYKEIACLGPGECFGEMALLTGEPRSANIQAMTHSTLLKLSRENFEHLIKKHPSLAVNFAGLLASRLTSTNAVVSGRKEMAIPQKQLLSLSGGGEVASAIVKPPPFYLPLKALKDKRFLGLILVTILCFLSLPLFRKTGLNDSQVILIELLLAATIIWSLNIVSYHAVSVALAVLVVLFGVTTPEKALSGFSSSSWFLVLGIFAISAAIAKTGLLYRFVLLVMKYFPPSYMGQIFGLAFSGLVLTPVIPSANGRVILASPLVFTLSEILGFKKRDNGSVGMAMASLLGFGHMSFMFMNGTATCLLALSLLPSEVSSSVTWGYWLKAAFPLGILFFLFSYLAVVLLYRTKEIAKLNPLVIEAQLKTLGPLTAHEKISLATIFICLIGFLTQPWHHINVAWVAMLSFLILFAGSVLEEKTVRADIDWNFLISFGALVGFGNVISASGLSGIIASEMKPYLEIFIENPLILLWVIVLAVLGLRFILPLPPALLVSILSIVPVTSAFGLHPFVIALVVLASANPWFLPHQNWTYQNLLETTEGRLFDHKQTLKLACVHVFIILAVVAISFPYWKALGLIP